MTNLDIIRRWYKCTILTLLSLVAIYIVSHIFVPGSEIIRMSKQEITDINLILFGTANQNVQPSVAQLAIATNLGKAGTAGLKSPALAGNDTVKDAVTTELPNLKSTNLAGLDTIDSSASLRKQTVFNYIFSVRKPLCPHDSTTFRSYFTGFSTTQFSMVIPNFPIRVKSYFWLTEGSTRQYSAGCGKIEGSVYLEIIFWTWFGLISGLLYLVSEALRTGDFDTKEIVVHISKFFYAPLISLIIYFSINRLISDSATSLAEYSNGTIVLSFILGFFSGRSIELLNRIKDLILPLNAAKGEDSPNTSLATTGSTEESEIVIDEATPDHKSVIG
jgi:hypothetical protein